MNQYTEGGLNLNNLWAILTEFYGGQYSSTNQFMYLLIYSISGYNPLSFHLASLLLHTGSACLAYIIIIRIFRQTNRRKKDDEVTGVSLFPEVDPRPQKFAHVAIAFVTALLFAIHPMNVETVAWISASKILVYAFFYLAATYVWLIYLEKQKIAFYLLSLLLFALSFGGKEQAVTFPVWLLMLYWLLGRSFKERKLWINLTPFFILAIAGCIVTILSHASNNSGLLSNQAFYPLWQRVILGSYSLIEYIVKFTIPYKLMYIYPFPMNIGEALPAWMIFYPAILCLVLVSLWTYFKRIPFSIGLAFFLIHIVIVLHIIPLSRFVVIADRYIYLACLGLSFILAFYLVGFLTNRNGTVRRIAIGVFVSISICLSVYSNFRCRDWENTDSIKKEIRELLKEREDYVLPEFERLLEHENVKEGQGKSGSNPEPNGRNEIIKLIKY